MRPFPAGSAESRPNERMHTFLERRWLRPRAARRGEEEGGGAAEEEARKVDGKKTRKRRAKGKDTRGRSGAAELRAWLRLPLASRR
jgi:hypothetical protein